MKNYDELTNDLLARRDRYIAKQKKKRKIAVTSLCCVCVVALLGFGLWKRGLSTSAPPAIGGQSISNTKPHIDISTAPTTAASTEPATTPTAKPIQITWNINKVTNTVGADRNNFNTPEYYSEKKDSAALTEYFGRDFSALGDIMPDGFQCAGGYTPTFFYKIDGTPAYDSCNFLYRKGDEQISIRASKIGAPYDYLYMLDNPLSSYVDGVEMVVGGFYASENSEEFDLIFADFSHNGIWYRVTAKNMPFVGTKDAPSWFIDILVELVKS